MHLIHTLFNHTPVGRLLRRRPVNEAATLAATAMTRCTCTLIHTLPNTHPVTGFSGADLSNLVNEAAILAATEGKTEISQALLDSSFDKVRACVACVVALRCVLNGWWTWLLWYQPGAAGLVVLQCACFSWGRVCISVAMTYLTGCQPGAAVRVSGQVTVWCKLC